MHWILNFDNGKSPCRVNQAASQSGQFIYSFGGFCQQSTINDLKFYTPIDVHVLNTTTLKWYKRPKPQLKDQQYVVTPYFRYGHTCVTYSDKIYLWGGRADWTNSLCNTLFSYKPRTHTWKKVQTEGNRPYGRDGHTACVIEKQGTMLIFGGYVQKLKVFSNDIYEYNFKTAAWTFIIPKTPKPHWRDFHTASSIDNKMYIFGGRMDKGLSVFTGESFYSNDLYEYDTIKKAWTELKPDTSDRVTSTESNDLQKLNLSIPCGRRSHSSVVFKRKIMIFGGFQENINKHFNNMYEFDVDKSEWSMCSFKGKCPSPRRRHSCCIVNNKMFLFGGTGPSASNSNTNNQVVLSVVNNQNESLIQNIRMIEPALHQLEVNLNQINDALRDRENLDFNVLNHVVGAALAALARPRLENATNADSANTETDRDIVNNQIVNPNDETINQDLLRVHTARIQSLMIQEPQQEYQENNQDLQEYEENERMQIDEHIPGNNLPELNQNNYLDWDDYLADGGDENFADSGDEDLIDEESDDEDINTDLISLSDLHVLDLEISSLRNLCMAEIVEKKFNYDSLPLNLIGEIDSLINVEKLG